MATISAQEFLKDGKTTLAIPANEITRENEQEPGFFERLANDLKNRGQQIGKAFSNAGNAPIGQTGLRTAGAVAGGVNDVLGSIIGAIPGVKQVIGTAEKIGEKISGPLNTQIADKIASWSEKYPQAAQDLKDLGNIAALLPAEKVVGIAGKGVLKGVEGALKGVEGVGGTIKSIGAEIFNKAIPLSTKEAGLTQTFRANNSLMDRVGAFLKGETLQGTPQTASKTALEKGFFGTEGMLGVQATKEAMTLWNDTIKPAVKGIKERIKTTDLWSTVEKKINKIADATTRNNLKDGFNAVKEDYKNIKDFSFERAQQIKSELDRAIPEKMFNGKSVSGAYNNIRKMIADSIRTKTYKALEDVNIRQAYLDYGNLKNLQEFGKKALTQGGLKGGFGGFVSTLYQKALTPIATVGGQILYKTGDGLGIIGEKGLKTLGDYLK